MSRLMSILHWLTVVLLFASALLAKQKEMDGLPLNLHTVLGVALALIMFMRIIVRLQSQFTSNRVPNILSAGLYTSIFFILGMGGWIAYQRNLLGYLIDPFSAFGRGGFHQLGETHKMGWYVLLGLLACHLLLLFKGMSHPKTD